MARLAWSITARRIALALGLIGLLAGCQQPGGTAPHSASTAHGDNQLRFFEPEFAGLLDQVVNHLGEACSSSATDDARLNACLRDHFAAAFDDSREGRRSCAFHADVSDYIGCIAIGNTLIDLRHRLADNTPLPDNFWRDDDAKIDALTDTIVKHGIDACGISGTDERIQTCVLDWFSKQIDLPPEMTARCEGQTDEKDRYSCVVEGTMVRYLQDHVPRLGAIST
jgi:hypothetical protein